MVPVVLERATTRKESNTAPPVKGKLRDKLKIKAFESNNYHIAMLTEKPGYLVDQEFALIDRYVLTQEMLPDWMDFNTIYLFHYSGAGDITEYKKKFHVRLVYK